MQDLDFSEYFYYDETSPSFLRWKVDVWSGRDHKKKQMSKGDVVGTLDNGYWRTRVKGKSLLVHRIISSLFGNTTENMDVDHIDGNTQNNHKDNLRAGTTYTNMQNLKMPSTNSSGVMGASWMTSVPNKTNGFRRTYAVAHWHEGGKTKFKYFPVKDFGLLPAFRMAVLHRKSELERLNLCGASYTDRHGT